MSISGVFRLLVSNRSYLHIPLQRLRGSLRRLRRHILDLRTRSNGRILGPSDAVSVTFKIEDQKGRMHDLLGAYIPACKKTCWSTQRLFLTILRRSIWIWSTGLNLNLISTFYVKGQRERRVVDIHKYLQMYVPSTGETYVTAVKVFNH